MSLFTKLLIFNYAGDIQVVLVLHGASIERYRKQKLENQFFSHCFCCCQMY